MFDIFETFDRCIVGRMSDVAHVFEVHKELASGLGQSLTANQLASAGARVYK